MSKTYIKNLVSIVLLCYKNAEFLDEAIESILQQTYQNFEIIVADDASNDGSREIIELWAKKDKRIIPLIHDKNLGMSGNQNSGFDRVQGEFVVPMSGDDILLPTKLEKQVEYLKNHPECGLVLSMTEAFDSETREVSYVMHPCRKPEEWFFRNDWFFTYPEWYGSHNNTTTMGRSSYYLQSRYDVRLKYKGEVLHAIENYAKSPEVKWHGMDEVLTKYRIHQGSATKNPELLRLIYEESWLVYAIASSRHPNISKKLANNKRHFIFSTYFRRPQLSKNDFNQLYNECGVMVLLYLLILRAFTKIGLLGVITFFPRKIKELNLAKIKNGNYR